MRRVGWSVGRYDDMGLAIAGIGSHDQAVCHNGSEIGMNLHRRMSAADCVAEIPGHRPVLLKNFGTAATATFDLDIFGLGLHNCAGLHVGQLVVQSHYTRLQKGCWIDPGNWIRRWPQIPCRHAAAACCAKQYPAYEQYVLPLIGDVK